MVVTFYLAEYVAYLDFELFTPFYFRSAWSAFWHLEISALYIAILEPAGSLCSIFRYAHVLLFLFRFFVVGSFIIHVHRS
jgi:hypothetical protein